MLSLVSLSISGCAATSGGSFCGVARPIFYDTAEQVLETPAEIRRQVLEHNRKGEGLCGW